jgi:hypothetical protein
MADHPIIFSAPMVRALLDGRKTMTRRFLYSARKAKGGVVPASATVLNGYAPFARLADFDVTTYFALTGWHKVKVGDRLWVRENHRLTDCGCTEACRGAGHVWYDADASGYRNVAGNRRRPSIHMPRWASRLTLIVTAVKIERLQDISEDDARAEGVEVSKEYPPCYRLYAPLPGNAPNLTITGFARNAFWSLWLSLHGSESWDANPFVVAPTFRVIRANIDAPEAAGA